MSVEKITSFMTPIYSSINKINVAENSQKVVQNIEQKLSSDDKIFNSLDWLASIGKANVNKAPVLDNVIAAAETVDTKGSVAVGMHQG